MTHCNENIHNKILLSGNAPVFRLATYLLSPSYLDKCQVGLHSFLFKSGVKLVGWWRKHQHRFLHSFSWYGRRWAISWLVAKRFWTSDSPVTCQPLVRYESADVHTQEKATFIPKKPVRHCSLLITVLHNKSLGDKAVSGAVLQSSSRHCELR